MPTGSVGQPGETPASMGRDRRLRSAARFSVRLRWGAPAGRAGSCSGMPGPSGDHPGRPLRQAPSVVLHVAGPLHVAGLLHVAMSPVSPMSPLCFMPVAPSFFRVGLAFRDQIALVIETPARKLEICSCRHEGSRPARAGHSRGSRLALTFRRTCALRPIVRCRDTGRYPSHDRTVRMPIAGSAWRYHRSCLPGKDRVAAMSRTRVLGFVARSELWSISLSGAGAGVLARAITSRSWWRPATPSLG
jgi:hypothetical protein